MSGANVKGHGSSAKMEDSPPKSSPASADRNLRSPKRRKLSSSQPEEESNLKAESQSNTPASVTNVSQQRPQSGPHTPPVAASDVVANARAGHLAALEKLASQLLSKLADMSSFKINKMLFGTATSQTHAYKALKSQFEQTRRLLARDSPFLSGKVLGISDLVQVGKIRTANMATFAVSAFSGELGLRMLDVMFLDVFVPENEDLKKLPGTIWLELKTQAFIAARRTASVSPYQAMLDLFPPNTEKMLLAKHPSSSALTENEQYFMQQFNSRQETLYADTKSNNLDRLHERHTWDDFSTALSDYLCYNYGSLDLNDFKAVAARAYEVAREGVTDPYSFTSTSTGPAQQASAQALQSAAKVRPAAASTTVSGQVTGSPQQNTASLKSQSGVDAKQLDPATQSPRPDIPHSSQSAATKELYSRAKAAGVPVDNVASSEHGRPWTQDEEIALLTGIDTVNGPHWSQILNIYGPGGSQSEVLRERTQNHLKEKAKYLNSLFLKAKVEVPHYLQLAMANLDVPKAS